MSLAKADAIAEAIKTALNGVGGPLASLTPATRKHVFGIKIEDVANIGKTNANDPVVTVFPHTWGKARTSRSTFAHEVAIGVCVQAYCEFTNTARLDELTLIVEGIADFLQAAGVMSHAVLMTVELDQLMDTQHAHTAQQFHSTPIFTYRLERSN